MAEIIQRELLENCEVVGYEYGGRLVRCKDCKYWHYYGNGYHFCDIFLIANEFDSDSYDSCPDDFCSRGVIKNEKTTY